jgi:predicted nucleic acid-binding protein
VTVVDTSVVVDYLLGVGVMGDVMRLIEEEDELAAPDLLVFETVAVLRHEALRGGVAEQRAAAAVGDLGDVPLQLFPSLPMRERAWSLHASLTVADALFVALAERLGEPLATKDAALGAAATRHTTVDVRRLG